ncbi:MAG: hypothetical protein HQK77_20490 [Desulfobacterales bacterium]|nr:hypothetical protein [Desulfobacterales bacterium]
MKLDTIDIVNPHSGNDYLVINAKDYNPEIHTLWMDRFKTAELEIEGVSITTPDEEEISDDSKIYSPLNKPRKGKSNKLLSTLV